MFARIKKSGKYQYLQIVETRRENKKVRQHVIATIGRMDQLNLKGGIEPLIRSLSRYSEKALLILSGKSNISAKAQKIGPVLIGERLWRELGIKQVIQERIKERKFGFNVERAIFLTVLHRLFSNGSDRWCDKWRRDYKIVGTNDLQLHHLYRAMDFLGERLCDQKDATVFSPRCIKDLIEEKMFLKRRDLFSGLDLVFFDTTSLYFEGAGGKTIGEKGFSKDHRPDLNQMVVGVVIDHQGHPICCEMWPGNTADVQTLIPVINRIRNRFSIQDFCLVADCGMISKENMQHLEDPASSLRYILGTRMRKINEIKKDVLSRSGRYQEVYPEGVYSKDPVPLKVKEVILKGKRYIVCLNTKQARKDAADRQAILEALEQRVQAGPKSMIGNKGYRKYLKMNRGQLSVDYDKAKADERFDGKWVLKTNTDLPAQEIALKYKELWQVEHLFRDMKSIIETRPIYHQKDSTIRGHVFCSFLALAIRKELTRRLINAGHTFEWADIQQDLKALQEVILQENSMRLAIRSRSAGVCGKVFNAVGVALPAAIREL
jgi:transposase